MDFAEIQSRTARGFIIAAVCAICAATAAAAANPVAISSLDQLQKIGSTYPIDGDFYLTADIDASSTRGKTFSPIGSREKPFTGKFDGKGHVVSNLYIDKPSDGHIGLFGYIGETGRVSNLGVADADVSGSFAVGALAGTNLGDISQSYSSGKTNAIRSESNVGGLVGVNGGIITQSYSAAAVKGSDNAGGLAGLLTVVKKDGGYIGESYATGTVSGNKAVGGLVGYVFGGSIAKSFAMGAVSARAKNGAGGLVGAEFRSENPSYSIVGQTGAGSSVKAADIQNCFWNIEAAGVNTSAGGGTPKTAEEMSKPETYREAGWDLSGGNNGNNSNPGGWTLREGQPYPQIESPYIPEYTIVYRANPNGKLKMAGADSLQSEYQLTLSAALQTPLITAEPNDGYHFVNWSDGKTTPARTDIAAKNATFTAFFAKNGGTLTYHTLTYKTDGNGKLTLNGENADAIHALPLIEGEATPLVAAVPNAGFKFSIWSDGKKEYWRIDTAKAGKTFTAMFTADDNNGGNPNQKYTLSYGVVSGGTLTVNNETQKRNQYSITLDAGENGPRITAVPDNGYRFLKWSDEITEPTRLDAALRNISVFASFTKTDPNTPTDTTTPPPPARKYTLTYQAGDGGKITREGSSAKQTSIEVKDLEVGKLGPKITATPDDGFYFIQWSDGSKNLTRQDPATGNTYYTAIFGQGSGPSDPNANPGFIHSYKTDGNGTLSVTRSGTTMDYQEYTVTLFPDVTAPSFTITAVPKAGYKFAGWTGNGGNGEPTATLNTASHTIMSQKKDLSFIANFTQIAKTYTLTYRIDSPEVTLEDRTKIKVGILIHSDKDTIYDNETFTVEAGKSGPRVEAVVLPEYETKYTFIGWSDGKTNPRQDAPTETSEKTFTAIFNIREYIPITDYLELRKIGIDANYPLTKKYELTSDIDASLSTNADYSFTPIGGEFSTVNGNIFDSRFTGTFRGNGYKISNLRIYRPNESHSVVGYKGTGLFGGTNGATITGVRLETVDITGNSNVGALVGLAQNTLIEDCKVVSGTVKGNSNVGGLAGSYESGGPTSDKKLINSSSAATVANSSGTTGENFGGLVGYVENAAVENCHSTGSVTSAGANVGGLVGLITNNSVAVQNCHSTGAVTASGDYVGGLIGQLNVSTEIIRCYSIGNVSGTKNYIGGLVGGTLRGDSKFQQCYATGKVTARGNGQSVGGFIGIVFESWSSAINDCYAHGDVSAVTASYVGGFAGNVSVKNTIRSCYSTGQVIGGPYNVGGFTGVSVIGVNVVQLSYYDKVTSGRDRACFGPYPDNCTGVTGLTTEEMQQLAKYNGWDFTYTWAIDEGNGYPYLRSLGETQMPLSKERKTIAGLPANVAPRAVVRGKTLVITSGSGVDLQVRFFDLRGRVVHRFASSGGGRISLARVPSGRYIMELREGKGRGNKRLSVQRVLVR